MKHKIDVIRNIASGDNVRSARAAGNTGISESIQNGRKYIERKGLLANRAIHASDVSTTKKAKSCINLLLAPGIALAGVQVGLSLSVMNALAGNPTRTAPNDVANNDENTDLSRDNDEISSISSLSR
ncbi:MAG: hypothetical protein P1U74_06865 [Legionellaceae bacterium]|nr:hypothetical protein [Legionellaceae bacterium]